MVDLIQQNQELSREVNRQRQQWQAKEHGKNSENGGVRNDVEEGDQSIGTIVWSVPTWREKWTRWRKPWRRWRTLWEKRTMWMILSTKLTSFTTSIMSHPLPLKFKIPTLDLYDGTWDPCDHIATFKMTMHLQGIPDEIMCRAFPTMLKGPVRVRFGKLPPNTITSFQELSKLFVNNFIGGQRHKHSLSNLLNIEQGENESLWTFINHINRETLLVYKMDDTILLTTFYNGVTLDLFINKLYDQEP